MNQPFVLSLYRLPAGKALLCADLVECRRDVSIGIGIGGAILLGDRWTVLDPLASIVVGAMLVHVAVGLLKGSMGELTESSLPADVEREIEGIISSFPDVSQPHNLRTRRIGNRIAIEAHVRMDGSLPLTVVHDRATAI